MKRRNFLKELGAGSAGLATAPVWANKAENSKSLPAYIYPKAGELSDLLSDEGLVVVRIAISAAGENPPASIRENISIKHAELVRSREFFFGSEEIVVLWLDKASEKSRIRAGGKEGLDISLGAMLEEAETGVEVQQASIRANFLMYHEIAAISPEDFGAKDPGPDFSFIAMADPQGGDPDFPDPRNPEFLRTRMKIHNAFIEESVDLATKLEEASLFCMVLGDVCDDWGYAADLAMMNQMLSKLDMPVLYGIGNHETALRSEFGPGYNMDAFSNFLAAQKDMNGLDKLLYSFNAGQWHFIVWPDPLRSGFWETHPHYFDWLERDLLRHKHRHTIVFQHVPSQPIGITPHINYAESVYVRRTFLNILAEHGNVKYLFSGHVHATLKACMKTAVEYRGIKMISLPAAGYRPRSFGEEDYYGGPSQGLAQVHITGDRLRVQYKTVTGEVFDFPEKLAPLDLEAYKLWMMEAWELPAQGSIVNGDFSRGLEGWTRRYVYMEDEDPSNICETRGAPGREGSALYLWCRRRAYQAPGQDRLPQDVNRLSQALSIGPGNRPLINLDYRIDMNNSLPGGFCGAFIGIEGFRGNKRYLRMLYSAGKIWVNNWGARNLIRDVPLLHFDLPSDNGDWLTGKLNPAADYESSVADSDFRKLGLDRLVITLGVWNLNDGGEWPIGIYFTGLSLSGEKSGTSTVNQAPVLQKNEEDIWWRNKLWPNRNIAGEHRYIIATRPAGQ